MPKERDFIVVLCTCGTAEEASRVARGLIEQRAAGCVNILPSVRSVYRWQGAVEEASEHLLIIKTRAACYPALEAAIRSLHSYEVPEIIALPIVAASKSYLDWLAGNLQIQSELP